jgi:hypothetical protein
VYELIRGGDVQLRVRAVLWTHLNEFCGPGFPQMIYRRKEVTKKVLTKLTGRTTITQCYHPIDGF